MPPGAPSIDSEVCRFHKNWFITSTIGPQVNSSANSSHRRVGARQACQGSSLNVHTLIPSFPHPKPSRLTSISSFQLSTPISPNMPPMKHHATPESESSSLPSNIPEGFTFRTYQREDLARSAIHDGAIIAWDPGLGKTLTIFAWPYLKHARRVLIVAPASLHDQIRREGNSKFGANVTPIPDQETALSLMRLGQLPLPGHQSWVNGHWEDKKRTSSSSPMTNDQSTNDSAALPTFFLTDCRWLGYNGGDEWAAGDADITDVIRQRRLAVIVRHFGMGNGELGHPPPDPL